MPARATVFHCVDTVYAVTGPRPHSWNSCGEKNGDLAETVTADMELITAEDNKEEWDNGFEAVGDNDNSADSNNDRQIPARSDASAAAPSSPEDESEEKGDETGKLKRVVHAVFLAAGMNIRPRETTSLLLALGIYPHRLVKVGLVDTGDLSAKGGHTQHHYNASGPRTFRADPSAALTMPPTKSGCPLVFLGIVGHTWSYRARATECGSWSPLREWKA